MFAFNVIPKTRHIRITLAVAFASTAFTGCSATQTAASAPVDDASVRTGIAALGYAHSDPDAIGSLDPTLVAVDADRYRHPVETVSYTPASITRHPVR